MEHTRTMVMHGLLIWALFFIGLTRASLNRATEVCDPKAKYRTLDGSCNNLEHPEWGQAGTQFTRLLPPHYEGASDPRSQSSTGEPLPSPREISMKVLKDSDDPSPIYTFMSVAFAQLIDHDITSTKSHAGVHCGSNNCDTTGECYPITVPSDDTFFDPTHCIRFVRSFAEANTQGLREQLNQITSFLDVGFVYSKDKETNDLLRDRSDPARGKLQIKPHPVPGLKGLLPQRDDPDCRGTNATIRCFIAGDARVNEQVALTSMHTIFQREHNEIEKQLYHINKGSPGWDGDRLYEESKRILTAAVQKIVFNEYLPLLVGPAAMKQYNLQLARPGQYWNRYDPNTNPSVFNNFATAAFRYAHSQVPNTLRFTDEMYKIHRDEMITNVILQPLPLYQSTSLGSGVDTVVRGACSFPANMVDAHMSQQLTMHLFTHNPPTGPGIDLASMNIQRGRDHGLAGYLSWRNVCGLSEDLSDIPKREQRRLMAVYKAADDIDLWIGALAEKHVKGGMVGPTMACLISKQFQKLRKGDRFWFEKQDDNHGFTPEQLYQIHQFSLAHIICANGDDIGEIQRRVLLQPLYDVPEYYRKTHWNKLRVIYGFFDWNERVPCQHIASPDFTVWAEQTSRGQPKPRKFRQQLQQTLLCKT